jgi:hypothetical protein
MFSITLLFHIYHPFNASNIATNVLQNWGDYADMTQAVLAYVTYASDVLLFCWFGTQLTQKVRQK